MPTVGIRGRSPRARGVRPGVGRFEVAQLGAFWQPVAFGGELVMEGR
jgi:hypothetical protein